MKVRKLSKHKTQYECSRAELHSLLYDQVEHLRQTHEQPHEVVVTLNADDQTATVLVVEKCPSGGQG